MATILYCLDSDLSWPCKFAAQPKIVVINKSPISDLQNFCEHACKDRPKLIKLSLDDVARPKLAN